MKRFSFRLESILSYRRYLEKKAQRDLLYIRKAYIEREQEVRNLVGKRYECMKECNNEVCIGINAPTYKIYQAFVRKLDRDIEEARLNLRNEKEKVKAQEQKLREESIRRETLETLKDLKKGHFIKELEKKDQKGMEEINTMRRGIGK